jgi:predicted lipid-binding transport protein (Tim44 family)
MNTAVTIATGPAAETRPNSAHSPLGEVLKRICIASRLSDIGQFLDGAKFAYETITEGFAKGDLEPLSFLLSNEVYEDFDRAIQERDERGERVKVTFIGINAADIVDAELADGRAKITVRFVGEMVSATYDLEDKWVAGHPARVVQVPELWSFERELRSSRPHWLLAATETGE